MSRSTPRLVLGCAALLGAGAVLLGACHVDAIDDDAALFTTPKCELTAPFDCNLSTTVYGYPYDSTNECWLPAVVLPGVCRSTEHIDALPQTVGGSTTEYSACASDQFADPAFAIDAQGAVYAAFLEDYKTLSGEGYRYYFTDPSFSQLPADEQATAADQKVVLPLFCKPRCPGQDYAGQDLVVCLEGPYDAGPDTGADTGAVPDAD